LQKECLGEFFQKIYKITKKEKFCGVYFSYRPALVFNDLELIKDILIKDFTSFHDRGVYVNEKYDILSVQLFSLEGQKWRDLRVKLSPTFTSGKLKGMFPVLVDCASVLENYISKQIKSNQNVIDIRDLAARYQTNLTASVSFGVEVDCIIDPDHLFRRMSRRMYQQTFKNGLRFMRLFMFPKSKIFSRLKMFDDDVEKFFVDLVRETIDYREKNNVNRNDFMQLLIKLKNEGYNSVDQGLDDHFEYFQDRDVQGNQKITFEEAVAQAFVFYVAGFETSSTVISYCLYELAKNTEVQRKLQQEIDEHL
jgi:cytochrome P450 family 6